MFQGPRCGFIGFGLQGLGGFWSHSRYVRAQR
jgi:hypothetical protein